MIVDDDSINIIILQEILQNEFSTITAKNGEEAIRYAHKFRPDIILLDIMMPGIDGYEVCRRLKSNPELYYTKIILVSAKTMLSERLTGYKAGADDYISKPFEPEELLAKVKVFLRLKYAEEINRTKENLLNLFSHETRTPLNSIIGFAKLIRNSRNLNSQESESVSHIINCGQGLLDFVNKIILLNDLKKGKKNASRQLIDLNGAIQECISSFACSQKLNKNDIVFSANPHVQPIEADKELLAFSLNCLINNAIKYSPEKSRIDIALSQSENQIVIKITDRGPGIGEDRLNTIFSEFNIEDIEHHNRGQGMSLSLVKYIAELHDGTIAVENNRNSKGCSFSLSLSKII